MQLLAEAVDGFEGQRRGGYGIARKNFKCRLAGVAMFEINLPQLGVGDVGDRAQGIANQRPAELQHSVVARRKRITGEPGADPGERFSGQCGKIFSQQAHLLQLATHAADGSAVLGELPKPTRRRRLNGPQPAPGRERIFGRASPVPLLGGVRGGFAGCEFRCELLQPDRWNLEIRTFRRQRERQLLLLTQRPRVISGLA